MSMISADRSAQGRSGDGSNDGVVSKVADNVDAAVRERPVIETITQLGWIAKGLVYLLMGATATSIARQRPTDDQASPKGALGQVLDQPGGRVLLGVLAVGLVLYTAWARPQHRRHPRSRGVRLVGSDRIRVLGRVLRGLWRSSRARPPSGAANRAGTTPSSVCPAR